MSKTKKIIDNNEALRSWLRALLNKRWIFECRHPKTVDDSIHILIKYRLVFLGEVRRGKRGKGELLPAYFISKKKMRTLSNILKTLEQLDANELSYIDFTHYDLPALDTIGTKHALSGLPPKALAIAKKRDPHTIIEHNKIIIQLSSANDDQVVWREKDKAINISEQSVLTGITSIVIKDVSHSEWATDSVLALVENEDPVIYPDKYFKNTGFKGGLLFYGGTLSSTLLSWFSSHQRASHYVMFPDYDIAGLLTYVKAKKVLGDSLSLYVPDNLESLFIDYSNPQRYSSQRSENQHGIISSPESHVHMIYDLIKHYKAGLDQEVLALI